MMDDLDHIMSVMATAFEPHWGEAWTRRQISDSLVLPTIFYRLIGPDGDSPNSDTQESFVAAGFTLSRHVSGEEELLLIAIQPEHRGQGLGRVLLKTLENDARRRGAKQLFLEMRSNNPAENLYRARGFSPIGNRKGYYRLNDGSRLDAVTFSLRL